MTPRWINLLAGVPIANNFATTDNEGTPIIIDTNTAIAYFLDGTLVRSLSGGSGGGGCGIPLVTGAEPVQLVSNGAGQLITTGC